MTPAALLALILAAQAGCVPSFEKLANEMHEEVRTASIYSSQARVNDLRGVALSAMLRVVRNADWSKVKKPRHYLGISVRNAVISKCRDFGRDRHIPVEDSELHDMLEGSPPTPEELLIEEEEAAAVREAVAELPANLREVMRRRFWEDETQKEVAEAMDISEGKVSQMEAEARALLKVALAEHDEPTAWKPAAPAWRIYRDFRLTRNA